MGRHGDADASALRAVTLAPAHPNPRLVLALIAGWRGETRQAIAHYESALALAADRSDLRILLGKALLDAGRRAEARAAFATAARKSRGSSLYLEAVAYQAIASETLDELPALAESMASVDTSNLYDLRAAAGLMLLGGEPAKAIALYERATGHQPRRDAARPAAGLRQRTRGSTAARRGLCDGGSRRRQPTRARRVRDASWTRPNSGDLRCWGTHYQRAAIAALRNQPAAAVGHLETATKLGWRRTWLSRIDPALQHAGGHGLISRRCCSS